MTPKIETSGPNFADFGRFSVSANLKHVSIAPYFGSNCRKNWVGLAVNLDKNFNFLNIVVPKA